jgi:hypothetical protein
MLAVLLFLAASGGLFGPSENAQAGKANLKAGARIFINPMPDDFDTFLKAAFDKKKVPLAVVSSKDDADLEMTGTSETQKASAAKVIFRGSWHSDEQASIKIVDLKSGEIVFAYSVNKRDSAHGKHSTAEACAVHIKDELEKRNSRRQ